ncbi:MAG: 30S ribosomal protein S12 methylthiotransferase RimO [Anaerolineales bacterium]|nr:30S ribosomal protein S12 methylthiotransferase RimO [Anaerolineales bacterium]MDW8226891.1 30S ribosomal protein S12 methylthiotransferase RimO [Anaerolineales bacterium]
MSKLTFHLTSLGCAKNTVDSDSMAQLLERAGYQPTQSVYKADVIIVNTCGFIEPAREESYRTLQTLAEAKRPGQLLIAAGCLTQRYGQEVVRRVPGIDGILGTRRWMDIVELVQALRNGQPPAARYDLPNAPTVDCDERGTLRASVSGSSAYLKIADGCRRPCAFCAIPLIKGTLVSRPLEAILADAHALVKSGVRELILIAQDTTDYGHDLGIKDGLSLLLDRLTQELPIESGLQWIRVLYAYPGYVTERLIELMATRPQILPYLDMPLQHAHPDVLRRMRRPANVEWVYRTIATMRAAIPNLALRTTFIVGYPGETEHEFQTLLDFVREMRFDRVGTFQFSYEEGTASAALGDPIPAEVKEERYQRLMELQQNISLQINQTFVGRKLDVLIEGRKKNLLIGRSYRDAPEIDGLVFLEGKAGIGEIIPAHITGAMAYDLTGVVAAR